jgi:chromate reductase, NAD(P)H dehydrogenase (quinone)
LNRLNILYSKVTEMEGDIMTDRDVAVFVGSLRKGAYTRSLAHALIELAPSTLKLSIVEIGDLPFYNQDLEQSPPSQWVAFRDRVRPSDAVLFVTPEYNRSVPAALKNAIDVGSRPYGKSVWLGKPAAIISSSPGAVGGFGANHHLRQSLVFLNVPAMPQPETYIAGVDKMIDAQGKVVDPSTIEHLKKFLNAFAAWVERNTIA